MQCLLQTSTTRRHPIWQIRSAMFDIFKPKSPKPTHCWSCEKKFHLFTRHAIKCAGPDCRHTVCHKCVATMRIYHKNLRFCQLCFTNIMSPPTRRSTPRKKTSAHAISSPALSPITPTTKTEAEETQHLKIETPAPRQALSLQEQIAQRRIIIREMEAVMMMNARRRQDLAMDPLALLVVPKAQSTQPVQAATHPFPHQDSHECSNFKQNPRDQVDSFAVSASHASTKTKTCKLSTSAATSNVNGTNGNYKTATSAPQRTNISGNHGVTRLHSKVSSIDVSLSVNHATGASDRSRSQRKSGRRPRSQRCRPDDVQD
ncbi:hypothetical protein AC1031_006516 [Aphanomyces cochlioides]|nr:hypothetical protein AC1031_006512 [Aphanomyces cochlioides]KAG9402977.1 hypothetical protein AC1031_006516 [Aphanomyces cochlioides]